MATLSLTMTTGLQVDSTTITLTDTDSQRILTAYQNRVNTTGKQADLLVWVAGIIQQETTRLVMNNETVTVYPTPPIMTTPVAVSL